MSDAVPTPDLPGTITWFKREPPSKVAMFEVVGWVVEPVAPSHHDVHCVMMRYGGSVAAGAEPPIPIGRPRVVAKHHPAPMRRWGSARRR